MNEGERTSGFNVYDNGTVYEGEFLGGERDGLGIVFYPNGNIFVGEFRKGEMEGNGTIMFSSGEFFVGLLKHSSIYEGVLYSEGQEVKGVWENGQLVNQEPVNVPSHIQQLHLRLFSTMLKHVHSHFSKYKDAPFAASTTTERPPVNMNTSREVPPTTADYGVEEAVDGSSLRRVKSQNLTVKKDDSTQNLRNLLTRFADRKTVFSCAGPARTEAFSFSLFSQRLVAFLFPFLALPWCPFAPFKVRTLSQEREYVVSGATLRQDFDSPTFSVYVNLVGMLCQVVSIVLVACKVKLGKPQEGRLTLPEMVIPCVLWFFDAFFSALYYGFDRKPHSLERLDRNLTPQLSGFAASVIDSKAKVCINTWDEEGRSKVRNKHYRFRWVMFSILYGAMMSLSAPSTRGGFGTPMFGDDSYEKGAALCAFFSTFFFSALVTFHVLKLTDLERELKAKLRVLTEVAFVGQKSIVNPSLRTKQPFNMDEPLCVEDLFKGFPGWFTTRSVVLYTSSSATHCARSGAMSLFVMSMIVVFIVALSDVFYMLANHYDRSPDYYSTAHSYCFFVVLFWGILLVRYMAACVESRYEFKRHLYVMDLVALYHTVSQEDKTAGEIINRCRLMSHTHDAVPNFFGLTYYPLVLATILLFNVAALAATAFQLGEVIYY